MEGLRLTADAATISLSLERVCGGGGMHIDAAMEGRECRAARDSATGPARLPASRRQCEADWGFSVCGRLPSLFLPVVMAELLPKPAQLRSDASLEQQSRNPERNLRVTPARAGRPRPDPRGGAAPRPGPAGGPAVGGLRGAGARPRRLLRPRARRQGPRPLAHRPVSALRG